MSLFTPVGVVAEYGGPISGDVLADLVNQGWLLCDGSLYAKDDPTYAQLFSIVGFSFGGDGSKMFAVPDLRGQFVRGADHGRGEDPGPRSGTGGVGSTEPFATGRPLVPFVTDTQWTSHTHSVPNIPVDGADNAAACNKTLVMAWNDSVQTTSSAGDHGHTITSGGDAETRPKNVYLYYLIRYQAA